VEKKQVSVDEENAGVVPRGTYRETLETIKAEGFCPFCEEHLFKHHNNPILLQSKYWIVTKNSWPYKGTQFHIIFIAREHITEIEEMSATTLLELQDLYRQVVDKHDITGATMMIRSGDTKITGATVNHLHAHMVVGQSRTLTSKPIRALVGFRK